MHYCTFQGDAYTPVIPPIGDHDGICDRYDRLILIHEVERHSFEGTRLIRVPKGAMHYGWVVGVFNFGE